MNSKSLSVPRFSFEVIGWLTGYLLIFYWINPAEFWTQLIGSWEKKLLLFTCMLLFDCFFEYYFHRYVLHKVSFSLLANFAYLHRKHHGLTPEEDYAIISKEQMGSARFPWWALPVFMVLYLPWLLFFQWLYPHYPYILVGGCAVTLSYAMYEISHALQHRPFERWKKWVESPTPFGRLMSLLYRLHRGHHLNPGENDNVVGFLFFPLCDLLFRTLNLAYDISPDGRLMSTASTPAKPRRFIAIFDRMATRHEESLPAL